MVASCRARPSAVLAIGIDPVVSDVTVLGNVIRSLSRFQEVGKVRSLPARQSYQDNGGAATHQRMAMIFGLRTDTALSLALSGMLE